jgi:serine/threonine-protein kinase
MKKIGRYGIRGLLGRGGMSVVFKAMAPVTGRIVALKLVGPRDEILIDLMGMERLKELFRQEAEIMGSIRHPNVAAILDYDLHQGRPFYTMEYHSHSLGTVMGETYRIEDPSRPVTLEKSVGYTSQVLKGLERLHYAGLIHRDIKPFNLLLTEQDQVKIIDFGLSRIRGEASSADRHKGLLIGSPYYAAPEQEQSPDSVDERADLFPVGVMLYRLLTGHIPDPTIKKPDPVSSTNPTVPEWWDPFFFKALAVDPKDRFSSAPEMLKELNALFNRWLSEQEAICKTVDSKMDNVYQIKAHRVRSRPKKVPLKGARMEFGLDKLWRPDHYHRQKFKRHNELIHAPVIGLIWQQSGSPFAMTWDEAKAYVQYLNRIEYNGIKIWRLPTVEELITLLTPPPTREDYCLDPLFERGLRWVWSSDRCTYRAAWVADVEMGYITRQDMTGYARVCAVTAS